MAYYDRIGERNILSKQEIKIKKTIHILTVVILVHILLLFFSRIRNFYFNDFPNLYFIGICVILITTIIRAQQGIQQGLNPGMEASRDWREKKEMLGQYDFIGPGPDYSNRFFNLVFIIGILVGAGLMIVHIITITA